MARAAVRNEPVPQRRTKKRAQIVDAAIDLFQRHGIKRVTVTEVCERASVSKMTFYKYFADKTTLARHVIDVLSDRILERIDALEAMDVPFAEKVEKLVEERVQMARDLSPVFIADLYNGGPELADFLRERGTYNRRHFVAFIVRAQEKGEVRADLEPELILAVLEKLNELGRDEALAKLCGGYEPLTRGVNQLFFHGLLGTPDEG